MEKGYDETPALYPRAGAGVNVISSDRLSSFDRGKVKGSQPLVEVIESKPSHSPETGHEPSPLDVNCPVHLFLDLHNCHSGTQ